MALSEMQKKLIRHGYSVGPHPDVPGTYRAFNIRGKLIYRGESKEAGWTACDIDLDNSQRPMSVRK